MYMNYIGTIDIDQIITLACSALVESITTNFSECINKTVLNSQDKSIKTFNIISWYTIFLFVQKWLLSCCFKQQVVL